MSEEELLKLAPDVITFWKLLERQLLIPHSKLDEIDIDAEGVVEKACQMLLDWSNRNCSSATYLWMYDVLSNPQVGRRDLARRHCC